MAEADYPQPSRSILLMKEFGPSALDADHPERICGMQYWFEFHDRATAERFQQDMTAFVMRWTPGAPGKE